jgi:hypothetical protein
MIPGTHYSIRKPLRASEWLAVHTLFKLLRVLDPGLK